MEHVHINGVAVSLTLKQQLEATLKWPIVVAEVCVRLRQITHH